MNFRRWVVSWWNVIIINSNLTICKLVNNSIQSFFLSTYSFTQNWLEIVSLDLPFVSHLLENDKIKSQLFSYHHGLDSPSFTIMNIITVISRGFSLFPIFLALIIDYNNLVFKRVWLTLHLQLPWLQFI